MAVLSLGQAAKQLGLSKPTVSAKIRNGQLSAVQNPDGSYTIDAAEVARFAANYVRGAGKRQGEGPRDKRDKSVELQVAHVELAAARTRIGELEADRDRLRRDLAACQERLQALQDQLAAIAQAAIERGQVPWWQRLIGKM